MNLVELVRPCPHYTGTEVGTTLSYSVKEAAGRTINDLIEEYAAHIVNGDVKVYDRHDVLVQHAALVDSNISIYKSFHGNGQLCSEMVYYPNDVTTLDMFSEEGVQTLEEYLAPDSAASTAWRETGELFSRTTSWNMLADTSCNKTYRYDQNGQFVSGDFFKAVVLNKQIGRQAVEVVKINEKGEVVKEVKLE
jgi:hypothetical protein